VKDTSGCFQEVALVNLGSWRLLECLNWCDCLLIILHRKEITAQNECLAFRKFPLQVLNNCLDVKDMIWNQELIHVIVSQILPRSLISAINWSLPIQMLQPCLPIKAIISAQMLKVLVEKVGKVSVEEELHE